MSWLTFDEGITVSTAEKVVEGLGGVRNIEDLESCIVRVRAIVADPRIINESLIREINPIAVVSSGRYVQIIVGPSADQLVEEMEQIIEDVKVY